MSNCLEVDNLSVAYIVNGNRIHPLSCINMYLEEGKFYGLIGPTGSGKSTLIKAIAKVLPQNAIIESGSIKVLGSDVYNTNSKHYSGLGIVLQNPYEALNPTLKILTQFRISYGLLKSYLNKDEFESEIYSALQNVELTTEILNKYPAQLSGGMNQRVNIALNLFLHPKILILDEPTSALDANLKNEIINLISNIQKKNQLTVLLISHDIKLIQSYAEHIYILSDGVLTNYIIDTMLVDIPAMCDNTYDTNATEPLIKCENLSKRFNDHQVIKSINFQIHKGTCFGIIGKSGSGKSTICKILIGLYNADGGRIVSKPGLKYEMVFQDTFSSLDPTMNIRQILNETRILEHNELLSDVQLNEWLTKFSLPLQILNQKAKQLSGGQRQMVSMIRILISSPDIVILDEPTSAMDVFLQKQLLDFLKKIQQELELTYILVSHDKDVIKYMCHEVLELE